MRILMLTLLVAFGLSPAFAKPMQPDQVPQPLKPWVDWVLHDRPERACPPRYADDTRDCVWTGELQFDAGPDGAGFTQSVAVYTESRVALPGDDRTWPTRVMAGDHPLLVVEDQGVPTVMLSPGRHTLTGEFHWRDMPANIGIDPRTGIVRYRLNGEELRQPQLRDGRLWLQGGNGQPAGKTPEDRLDIEVYRLVADGHPLEVTTQLAIEVSGRQREAVIGHPLLPDFVAVSIDSPLPARLEPDGSLRVQLRPGSWRIEVLARHPGEALRLASPAQIAPWPAYETWVYRASPADRLTEIEGVTQIDPRQSRVPPAWANLPVYHLAADEPFRIRVIRRGDPEPAPDRLALERTLWLDFDGGGYTVRDRVQGAMSRDGRLSVDPDFALGRVTVDGEPQFITRLPEEARDGVELRRGPLNLAAESRLARRDAPLPATGWGRDFQKVATVLQLPPGWTLIAAAGADNVPDAWVERWTLYDIFLVLITALAVGRLWGWRWAWLALLTLVLTWHEPDAPRLIWLYLLAATALLRRVPRHGRLFTLLRFARLLGLLALLVILLPFMVQQAREGLYPQLERHPGPAVAPATVSRELAQPAGADIGIMDEMEGGSSLAKLRKSVAGSAGAPGPDSYRYRGIEQPVDPAATIQTGPGLPDWQWRSARLVWNGPVAGDQGIRLYLLGPTARLLANFLMLGLLLVFAWRVLDIGRDGPRRAGPLHWLGLVLAGAATGASAGSFPPPELLQQLEQRLLEIPVPAPRAAIESMDVRLSPDTYSAALEVHALASVSVPLPLDNALAAPVRVLIDDVPVTDGLYRIRQSELWLLLPEGRHRVELEAFLPALEQLQIPLPLRPHRVTVSSDGWTVEGIDKQGVPGNQLSLTRILETPTSSNGDLAPAVSPPFLRVTRTVRLGINWEIHTRVTRESPVGTPLSVQVPVVNGAASG